MVENLYITFTQDFKLASGNAIRICCTASDQGEITALTG